MPDTPTPGQVCYEAYLTARHGYAVLRPWPYLPPARRAAWEAAAQAVLAMQEKETRNLLPAEAGSLREDFYRNRP